LNIQEQTTVELQTDYFIHMPKDLYSRILLYKSLICIAI
jgi:hypothetical protein